MILIFILTIGIVSANDANTTDILNSDDSNEILSEEISVEGDSFKDIQDAVDSSNDGDTIYLNGKTYVGNGTQITISKSLTIDGSSPNTDSKAIIDANDSSIAFNVNGKYNMVFKNIIFQRLKIVEEGGAINQEGGNLSIINCEARDVKCTTVHIWGGIIAISKESNLYIDTFKSHNISVKTSSSVDGLILAVGSNSKVKISNFKAYDNNIVTTTTRYVSRGGLVLLGTGCEASISNFESYNNTYSHNTKDVLGSTIYADTYCKVNITNITVKDNTVNTLGIYGGVIVFGLQYSNVIVNDCISKNNKVYARNYILGGLTFTSTYASIVINNLTSENDSISSDSYILGAICRGTADVMNNFTNMNVYFCNVSAKSYAYALFYTGSNAKSNYENITLIGNNVSSNEDDIVGSFAIFGNSNATFKSINIFNNTFYAAKYNYAGGIIMESGCNVDIYNVNFSNNRMKSITNHGFLRFYGVNLNMDNITVSNNNVSASKKNNGFLYTSTSCIFNISNINIEKNDVYNPVNPSSDPYNKTTEYGMAILKGIGTISHTNISHNRITSGLGIGMQVSPVSVDNPAVIEFCIFENNTSRVTPKDYDDIHFINHGGAICISGAYDGAAIIRNCLFVNNANQQGGAITPHNNCIVENCRFINNTATKFYGGAISTEDGFEMVNSNITIRGCYFENNVAPIGGAIQAKGDYVKIYNCTFKENIAVQGGAVFLEGNNLTVYNCTFIYNNATDDVESHGVLIGQTYLPQISEWNAFGGAVYIHGNNANLNDNIFKYNSAITPKNNTLEDKGGAIYIFGDNATIIKSYFDDNFAHSGNGSAIYIMGVNATVDLSEFYNHDAGRGTVFIRGSHAEILNSIFKRNTASKDGAGVFSIGNYSLIDNCQFDDNNATVHGGAVYTQGDYIRVINSKFNSNNAHPRDDDHEYGLGGAIFIEGDFNDIAYCDFSLNTARNGSAIYNRGKDLTIEDCNFHYNQAYSYQLDIRVKPVVSIYTKDNRIEINITHIGGDNIINAIYNDGSNKNIFFYNVTYEHSSTDGGKRNSGLTRVNPVESAEKSNNGALIYQDSREDLQIVNVTIAREEYSGLLGASEISGDVIRQFSGRTGLYGNISFALTGDLKPGTYNVYASHPDDRLYKGIENHTRFEITPQVDLKITKSSDRDSYFVGDTATYTIIVESLGTDAHDVDVREILPEGFEIIDYTATKGEFGDNVWYIPEMAEGAKETLTVKVKLDRNGTFTNIVTVSSKEEDINESDNVANRTITVKNYVDLQVTKTSDVKKIKVGDTVVWTITVKNMGIINATGVRASDKLPDGLIYISHSSDKGEYDPNTGMWSIGELAVNETVVLNITTEALKAGSFTNTVSVTSNEEDRNSSNDEANCTVEVTEDSDDEPSDDPGNYHPGESQSGEGSSDTESKHMKVASGRNATGNPIFLILLALLSICITFRRKF